MADYDFVTAFVFCHDLETLWMKISSQAVTTTRLIKYNTVKHNMLHISKYNEMNITPPPPIKSSPKAETAKRKWRE